MCVQTLSFEIVPFRSSKALPPFLALSDYVLDVVFPERVLMSTLRHTRISQLYQFWLNFGKGLKPLPMGWTQCLRGIREGKGERDRERESRECVLGGKKMTVKESVWEMKVARSTGRQKIKKNNHCRDEHTESRARTPLRD